MAASSHTSPSVRPDWVLRTANDARRALVQPGVILTGSTLLSFAKGPLADPRIERRARRLRFWQSVCGCQLAAFAFLGWILFAHWSAWNFAHFDGWALVGAFAQALLAAIFAKFAVIVSARAVLAIELLWLGYIAEEPLFGGMGKLP